MLRTHIAGRPVCLPDPDRIDIPAIRKALLSATELAGHAEDTSVREIALLQNLRDTVLAESDRWGSKAYRDAEIAIHKLSHAIDLAEEAQADLRDAVGVAGMLARLRVDPTAPLVLVEQPYGYRFDLAPGIRGLLEALAAVSDEIAAINAASTKTPSHDTDDAGTALSEAHTPSDDYLNTHNTTTKEQNA